MTDTGTKGIVSIGQIADAIGISPRTVRGSLGSVQPAGTLIRNGNECAGFEFEQLPPRLQERVLAQQTRLNYRTPEAVLLSPTKQWQPNHITAKHTLTVVWQNII